MRISKDKNSYIKGRYVPEGVTYDITIRWCSSLMEIDGFVREVRSLQVMTMQPAKVTKHV